jgi:hypothetical protein
MSPLIGLICFIFIILFMNLMGQFDGSKYTKEDK